MQQGLYGWFSKNLKGRKGQQGFTLIELLVVVTILGVLAAIVTLSLVGLTTNATAQACNQEYRTVQAGLDAFMANNNVDTISALDLSSTGGAVSYTNDMATTLITVGGTNLGLYQINLTPSNPTNYVRNATTQYWYSWNASGRITHIGTGVGGASVPNCVPH
jgi:prepilin-type N-terminal cleavage/methylation domain-containing protein